MTGFGFGIGLRFWCRHGGVAPPDPVGGTSYTFDTNRTDLSLEPGWQRLWGDSGAIKVNAGTLQRGTTATSEHFYAEGSPVSGTQRAGVTFGTVGGTPTPRLVVLGSGSVGAFNGYTLRSVTSTTLRLGQFINGAGVTLGSDITVPTFSAPFQLEAVVGATSNVINVYDATGTLLYSVTDSATGRPTSGYNGLISFTNTSSAVSNGDDFKGNLQTPSAPAVVNQAPTAISLSSTSWSNAVSSGTAVATISGSDPESDALTFSLPDAPANYTISGTSLVTAGTLTAGISTLTVRATDTAGNIFDQAFDITVTPQPAFDQAAATQLIQDGFATQWAGMDSVSTWDVDVVATTAQELANALAATGGTANIGKKQRITCNWNGVSTKGSAIGIRPYSTRTDGWSDNGGGVLVVAGAGYAPELGDSVSATACRGLQFKGIRFSKEWDGVTGKAETTYGFQALYNTSFPARPVIRFTNCIFGSGNATTSTWVTGANIIAGCDSVCFDTCSFKGNQIGTKCVAKLARFINCDFQLYYQDGVDLFGHTTSDTPYYAYAWFERCTWRNAVSYIGNLSHMDCVQTGYGGDTHKGYRVLIDSCITHNAHKYANSSGGTQGFYNDDYFSADNLFVLKNSFVFPAAPYGLAVFSPKATQVSFVDSCTMNRAGVVPSGFTGDGGSPQDFACGGVIMSHLPADGNVWIKVTNTAVGTTSTSAAADVSGETVMDCTIGKASGQRPENYFAGRDFTRGGTAANGIADKFGYILPNETGTQAQFVADIWANWAPKVAYAGQFAPDPTGLTWAAPVA